MSGGASDAVTSAPALAPLLMQPKMPCCVFNDKNRQKVSGEYETRLLVVVPPHLDREAKVGESWTTGKCIITTTKKHHILFLLL